MTRSVLGLLALTLTLACGRSRTGEEVTAAAAVRVHCVAVVQRALRDVRTLRGSLAAPPDRDAILSAQVAGRLLRVAVREGDVVARDAVLAEIESRGPRDAVRQAEAQLAQARSAKELAGSEATRQEHLVERGINARQLLEQARQGVALADAQVATAKAQLDLSQQSVDRTQIRAPFAGVVVRLYRRTGEVVDGTVATPVLEVADVSSLELAASVPALDLVALHPGQAAILGFDALAGQSFAGTVKTVSPAIDPTSGLGLVRIALAQSVVRPPLGLAGEAAVTTSEPRPAWMVPAGAVRSSGGAHSEVVVCAAGKATLREVTTGIRRDGFVEILHGVDGSARVVSADVGGLEDGTSIEELP